MKDRNFNYIKDLTRYERQKTWEVNIGGLPVGGNNPIRIQSMTTSTTKDTDAVVEQIIRLVKAGADYVRVTVKGIYDAENIKNIRKELTARGYDTPIIGDIHFNPRLAEIAAKSISKIRINPGNFYDKRALFKNKVYSDDEY
ncbi:MAG TPA: flavodoxin-dependent (E)-4-hydroxy-3-methylbut-2-enyl-diphosphate synthase, partial [Draconibacterium sp.]|nr:flavodoxin-dependent (E)-4-hydroxy-3-methylbut-2-enyl-diphosphate synthase [Draconibacterium sp.]